MTQVREHAAADFLAALRLGLNRCLPEGDAARPATAILVGVSGGADSVALFRGLFELQNEFRLTLYAAHLNHQLRGADSDADSEWVDQLGKRYGVPVVIEKWQHGGDLTGLEETARLARHRFLDESAKGYSCAVVATAHTAGDQAETVLHHVVRGTGLSGLRGIPWTRETAAGLQLIRPMLAIRRDSIEGFLSVIGQDYRFDVTNDDSRLTRNWLRHQCLPDLRRQFGPQVDASLARLADQAAEVEQTMQILAEELLGRAVLDRQPEVVRMDCRVFSDRPAYLVREALRRLWISQGWGRQNMGVREWTSLGEVAMSGGDITLPGSIRARQHPPGLLLLQKTDRAAGAPVRLSRQESR